jgi:hypothetical protein
MSSAKTGVLSTVRNSNYVQGRFTPKNIAKYSGDPSQIFFRSSWEYRLGVWLDSNQAVKSWTSEEIVIPYLSAVDGKVHRYFVDFAAVIQTKTGLKKYLIEVKPYSQTIPPTVSKRKKPSTILKEQQTWLVNQSKWQAAKQYADKLGYEFIIITENELGLK